MKHKLIKADTICHPVQLGQGQQRKDGGERFPAFPFGYGFVGHSYQFRFFLLRQTLFYLRSTRRFATSLISVALF